MEFEFDPAKSHGNREKHGIDFSAAETLWSDPKLTVVDAPHPFEPRLAATGKLNGKFWTAIFTYRGTAIRIISVRRARKREIAEYGASET